MKRWGVLFLLLGCAALAQNPPDWKEARDFHNVLAPMLTAAEEGNSEPARARAAELSARAEQLSKSDFPPRYDSPATLSAVKQLRQHTDDLLQRACDPQTTDGQLLNRLRLVQQSYGQLTASTTINPKHKP